MGSRPTISVAVACGAAGAYVDLSAYLESEEDFTYRWGRQTGFEDTAPGEFSFVLDNRDGWFTPGNVPTAAAVAAGVVNTFTEGMGVCWQLNTRLVAGTIQAVEPTFRDDDAAHGSVRVTADDMLGSAARLNVPSLANSIVLASSPSYYWPLSDPSGSTTAREMSGRNGPPLVPRNGRGMTFGVDAIPAVGETQGSIDTTTNSREMNVDFSGNSGFASLYGYYGVWVTLTSANPTWYLRATQSDPLSVAYVLTLSTNASGQITVATSAGATASGPTLPLGVPAYVVLGFTSGPSFSSTISAYLNGVLVATVVDATAIVSFSPSWTLALGVSSSPDSVQFSHFSKSPTLIHEEVAASTTEAARLQVIDTLIPEITIATLPTDLSTAVIGPQESGGAALDVFNDIMRTEQGYIYAATTGTLTSPVQKLVVRARNRPTTVLYSYGLESDLDGAPSFARDTTDIVSTVNVSSSGGDVTVTDTTLVARVGSANDSLDVLYASTVDAYTAGTDRINRGKNTAMKITDIAVDGRVTAASSRYSDLIGAVPGDRIQLTGLPSTQLGIATWDGWLLGGQETHNTSESTFAIYLDPCTPNPGIYDTDRYMDSGELTLSGAITSGATSISAVTTGAKFTTAAGDFPFYIQIDSEILQVTNVTAATPQVLTVARGQLSTTAAAHSSGAVTAMYSPTSIYAY